MQYTAPNETLTLAYSLWLKRKALLVSELEINTHEGETSSIIVILTLNNENFVFRAIDKSLHTAKS